MAGTAESLLLKQDNGALLHYLRDYVELVMEDCLDVQTLHYASRLNQMIALLEGRASFTEIANRND